MIEVLHHWPKTRKNRGGSMATVARILGATPIRDPVICRTSWLQWATTPAAVSLVSVHTGGLTFGFPDLDRLAVEYQCPHYLHRTLWWFQSGYMCRNRRRSSITLCLYGWHASPFFRWLRHDWWSLFVALSVLTSSCRGLKRGFCSDFSVSWSLLFFAASGNLKLDIHPTSSNLVLKKTFWGRRRRNRTVFSPVFMG